MTQTMKLTANTEKQMVAMYREFVNNEIMSRTKIYNTLMDPRRDYRKECGYPETGEITLEKYQDLYDRFCIATRVVQVMPLETWKVVPMVFEDEDPEVDTAFEKKLGDIDRNLLDDGESWFEGEQESSMLMNYLLRADIESGIGHYGVIFFGLSDAKTADSLRLPCKPSPNNELLFLRVLPERLALVSRLDNNPQSPRYGKPETYSITFSDPNNISSQITAPVGDSRTMEVHHSRILHIVDTPSPNENYGVPRQRPVLDRLLDCYKLYGGSAEGFWQGSFPGISLETHPQLGGDVTIDVEGIKTQMEQYINGMQRYFALSGMAAKSLAPQSVDPTPFIKTQLEAICIMLGIPMRVFLGSERGELSSAQDKDTWNGRIRSRQQTYVTPRIIARFINRLIQLGVLPPPKSFKVEWPDLDSLTPAEEADVALKTTQSLAAYAGGGVDTIIDPLNYFTRILKFSDADAQEIIDATAEHVEEQQAIDEEEQLRKMDEGLIPDVRKQNEMISAQPPKPGFNPNAKG